jgi:hypothetical protein
MRFFQEYFKVTSNTRILDVGGTWLNWSYISINPRLTILNLSISANKNDAVDWIIADCKYLPFKEGSFDIVYSNSLVEHLGDIHNQIAFASECMRVGFSYYIQTPNKWFPIEPHFLTPVIHWLPKGTQKRLVRNFSIWGLLTRPTQERCNAWLDDICFLDQKDMGNLFPDAELWYERVVGLKKSIIAVKLPDH